MNIQPVGGFLFLQTPQVLQHVAVENGGLVDVRAVARFGNQCELRVGNQRVHSGGDCHRGDDVLHAVDDERRAGDFGQQLRRVSTLGNSPSTDPADLSHPHHLFAVGVAGAAPEGLASVFASFGGSQRHWPAAFRARRNHPGRRWLTVRLPALAFPRVQPGGG